MGMNITTDDKGVMIFRKDGVSKSGNPYSLYSLAISSKKQDGTWIKAYIDCSFKKGIEVYNKAKIKIKSAFFTVNEYGDKKSAKIIITDFDVIDAGEAPAEPTTLDSGDDFMSIPDGMEEEMPFN